MASREDHSQGLTTRDAATVVSPESPPSTAGRFNAAHYCEFIWAIFAARRLGPRHTDHDHIEEVPADPIFKMALGVEARSLESDPQPTARPRCRPRKHQAMNGYAPSFPWLGRDDFGEGSQHCQNRDGSLKA